MLAVEWMSPNLVTVSPEDSLQTANYLINAHKIRHLPVIRKGKLKGIVTDRDIKKASASDATTLNVYELRYLLDKLKVKEIMSREVHTIKAHDTVEEAANIMLQHKISGLPIVDEKGAVIGMITQDDVFRALVSLAGAQSGGIQFAMELPDEPGSIKRAADIIRKYGGKMVSILTSYQKAAEGKRRVYIRMKGVERSRLEKINKELAEVSDLLYVLDSNNPTDKMIIISGLPPESLGQAAN